VELPKIGVWEGEEGLGGPPEEKIPVPGIFLLGQSDFSGTRNNKEFDPTEFGSASSDKV
jgi:hypothetical protein